MGGGSWDGRGGYALALGPGEVRPVPEQVPRGLGGPAGRAGAAGGGVVEVGLGMSQGIRSAAGGGRDGRSA